MSDHFEPLRLAGSAIPRQADGDRVATPQKEYVLP